MASKRSGVTSVVQNEFPLAYYFHCAIHCLNLSASAAVKVSAIQNAENVARKAVKMFKASAKKTALLKCCIKKDVSSQVEAKRHLVGLCETRFVESYVSISALVAEARRMLPPPPTFFQGDPEGALIYAFISTIIPVHERIYI